ncbi:type II secretion system protein F [Vibrio sp. 10N.286.49.C2]|uniref:type II secretion system F family protein n=1 Tax=unclassified Vibrio TaxID=2614977 RepID=UPI000C83FBAB|nr:MULTISPECIES: type II secretion system F family protein [unclassified Vibrio]PMH34247.1 type II secretion system protein F [Vibrio sp. 10N.286.49.C2]PMH52894.1 type II secretion system protein F [Vibrio sp. 10N.286.49.B1]PMH80178.1 type II secretion system protein F [Vibrio sp. 10N.286.48.B7]
MAKIRAISLKTFRWKGINSAGKKVSGHTLAMTENEVRDKLKNQHVKIKKITRHSVSFWIKITHRIERQDITTLTRQLATMLSTGIPIIHAIKLIADNHTKAEMKSVLGQIGKAIEAGTPISQAMQMASVHFDSFYVDMVATGEASGTLPDVFERLAVYREKQEALKSKVIKALIYPGMVVLVSFLVTFLMLTQVIPEFESMFKGFNATLPWFTLQILMASHWLQANGTLLITSLIASMLGFRQMRKHNARFKFHTSRYSLSLPVIGGIISKASIAKFSRTLATSFSSGIPILSSIQASAKTADCTYYQQSILSIHSDVVAGTPIHLAMRNAEAFPEMVLQMVMIGEESGQLDDMLNKIAAIYEFEVDNTVDNLGKILEPFIIVFLGTIVGGLVVAMYLPIFNLMSVIG